MGRVLLYNFREERRRKAVKALLFRLGVPSREIPPEAQGLSLSELLEAENPGEGPEIPAEAFREEMLVMQGLEPRAFHGLLDGLKAAGIRVPLKAVVTEHNLEWSSIRLHAELRAEQEALCGGAAVPDHRKV